MKRYRDIDGDIWEGPDDENLRILYEDYPVGPPNRKLRIEEFLGELVPLEDD